jgi:hypothetical protein
VLEIRARLNRREQQILDEAIALLDRLGSELAAVAATGSHGGRKLPLQLPVAVTAASCQVRVRARRSVSQPWPRGRRPRCPDRSSSVRWLPVTMPGNRQRQMR